VSRPPAYAELVDLAGRHADHGAALGPWHGGARARTGRRRLVSVAARHVPFLLSCFQPCQAAEDAARFVAEIHRHEGELESTHPDPAEPLHRAAQLLGAAHDLLASHLGPDRERRSPLAPGHDDEPALRYLLGNVADVVLRATADPATTELPHLTLPAARQAGYQMLARLGPIPVVPAVADLRPLLLAMPDADDDPVLAACDAVRHLRQVVFWQVQGVHTARLGPLRAAILVAFLAHDVLRTHPDHPPDPDADRRQHHLGRNGARLDNRPSMSGFDPDLRATVRTTYQRLRAIPRTPGGTDPARLSELAHAARDLAGDVDRLDQALPPAELPVFTRGRSGRGRWGPAPRHRPPARPPTPDPQTRSVAGRGGPERA
jgi:hypothetical protein